MEQQKPKLRKRQVDLLLLSIIHAYDHPDRKSAEERLAEVREALFGQKRKRGRAEAYDDLALFKILAEHRKRELDGLRRAVAKLNANLQTPEWEKEIARDPKPVREAAREFSRYAGSAASIKGAEDRLRRKARKPLTAREMSEIESLLDPDAPLTKMIIDILDLLELLGVQSETIWDETP